jgi:hypothetical protein
MNLKSKILFLFLATSIVYSSCDSIVRIQQKELYEANIISNVDEIDGFKALYIFRDEMDKSVWVSPESNCVTMKSESKNVFADNGALHIKWDKVTNGCKWIGCGFGWNNWVAKNMINITDVAAVQMQVKSAKGTFSNLPVAFAFEDYGGVQSYFGFQKNLASGTFNDSTWTSVTIPLSKFDFVKSDFNIETVKQFMIQLEGDGDIYLDNIKLIKL